MTRGYQSKKQEIFNEGFSQCQTMMYNLIKSSVDNGSVDPIVALGLTRSIHDMAPNPPEFTRGDKEV